MPTHLKLVQTVDRNAGFASLRPANRLVEALDRVSGNVPFKVPSHQIEGGGHEVATLIHNGQMDKRAAALSVPSADHWQDIDQDDAETYRAGLSKQVLA